MLEGVPRGGSSPGFFEALSLLVAKIRRHEDGYLCLRPASMLHEMSIAQCRDKPMIIAKVWLMSMLMLICCERKTLFVR